MCSPLDLLRTGQPTKPFLPHRVATAPLILFAFLTCGVLQEWEKFKAKGWPRRVSRLYDNVDGVLRDPHCLRYFVAYLKSEKLTPLLKFWSAAEKFAQGNFENVEAPPGQSAPARTPLRGVFHYGHGGKQRERRGYCCACWAWTLAVRGVRVYSW